MFPFFLLFCKFSKESNEKYSYCMALLRERIPIDKNLKETQNIMKQYIQYFNNIPPNYKEKEQICFKNKDLFEAVANDLLRYIQLDNQITDKQMSRCISRNLPLFAYTVISMANNQQYSAAMEKIKQDFLSEKNQTPQNFIGKKYVLPQVTRTDLQNTDYFFFPDDFEEHLDEQNEDDQFIAFIGNDPYGNFFYNQ